MIRFHNDHINITIQRDVLDFQMCITRVQRALSSVSQHMARKVTVFIRELLSYFQEDPLANGSRFVTGGGCNFFSSCFKLDMRFPSLRLVYLFVQPSTS